MNYTDANGCSGATSATVLTSTGTIPTLTGTSPVCLNSDGSYTTQSGFTNYTWSATGGTITSGGTGTDNTATINWTTAGTGTVSINFTDGSGCVAVTPTVLPVVVHDLPSATISGNITVCQGAPTQQVNFTGASGTKPYTFTYKVNGGSDQTVSTTGAANSVTVDQPTGTAGPFIYHLVSVSDGNSCSQMMSVPDITITVNPTPTIFTVSGGGAYCSGGSGVDIILSGSETGVNYQLYNGASTVGLPMSGTGSALTFSNQTAAGTYTVIATNASTPCTSNMSGSVTVTINPLPTVFNTTGGGAYCNGGAGVVIGLSGSQSGVNYQLYNGASAVGSPVAGTGSSISFGNQTAAGTYTARATNATTACTNNMTGSVTITVNPLPGIFNVTGGGAYCSGGSGLAIGLSGSETGVNYQLYNGASAVGAPVNGTGGLISFGNQTAAGTYTVVATNATTSCASNMTGSVTVTVNPLPTIYSVTGGGTYCNGGAGIAIGLSGSQSGVNYQLYIGASAVGSPMPGTGGS